MYPVAAIWIVIWVARYLANRGKGGSAQSYSLAWPRRPILGMLGATLLLVWYLASDSRTVLGLFVASLAVAFSHVITDWVVVPLGLPRLALFMYRVGGGRGNALERRSSAALAAARALARRPSDSAARLVERHLSTCLEL